MSRALALFTVPTLLAAVAACSSSPAPEGCPELPDPGPAAVSVTMPFNFVADDARYELGDSAVTDAGATFSVSKLRMYVSDVQLRLADGGHEHGQLLDADGTPLSYGVALLDGERPDSLALRFRAPPGEYESASITIGVPPTCSDEETQLNHSDASTMAAPLDVDSDMYWSWDPGYVFFKIDGRVDDDGSKPFFYHVGEDNRLMKVELPGPIVIAEDGTTTSKVVADITRLFTSPSGESTPRVDGEDDDRKAHGGPLADQMKVNIEGSDFLRVEGGAQ